MNDGLSHYSDERARILLDALAKGTPLEQICREQRELDEFFPAARTVSDWRKSRPDFDAAFLAAREAGYDAIAADCLAIADDGTRDYTLDEDGVAIVNHDHIQRSRLRVDTRLKLLAKWDPRRYGDKVEHTGAGGSPLVPSRIEIVAVAAKDGKRA